MATPSSTSLSPELHVHTPTLSVLGPHGMMLRTVKYCRSKAGEQSQARVELNEFDAAQRITAQWDSRLWAKAQAGEQTAPNLKNAYNLGARLLASVSVDAGWNISLLGDAGQTLATWDSQHIRHATQYDMQLRPVAQFEQPQGGEACCVERLTYAQASLEEARKNRCGELIRHDDPAGSRWNEIFGISGQPLTEKRRFCGSLASPNWPEFEAGRDDLLEIEEKTYVTHWRYDALGAVLEQTDALDHVQRFEVDVAGRPCASYLDDVALLKYTLYNAFGQVEFQQTGNEVVTSIIYSPENSQPLNLKASKPGGKLLQDLHFQYDPVGNIERIEDVAQPVQWFAQQQVEDVRTYTYDTLYQLTRATGRENASQTIGPGLPNLEAFGAQDDSRWRNYSQTYDYDGGGNLIMLKHDAGASNSYKREMIVDEHSNRSLLKGSSPIDFAQGFDANGNQNILSPGQSIQWNARNQLHQVTQVQRDEPDGQDDDVETYIYDGDKQRVRKVRRAKTRGAEQVSEVRYLPGLEIRTRTTGEQLHVVIAQAGRSDVRWLHWENELPKSATNNQFRYSLSDHLESSVLELDQHAELISQERYYPFGGTAWWAARSVIDAKYKTARYSGKERDATGLYYYGFRYYAPWLQRWINPDPAGNVDGLNLYCMVKNDPTNSIDNKGETRERALANWEKIRNKLRRRDNQVPGAEYLFENVLDPESQTKGSRRFKGVKYLDEKVRSQAAVTFEYGTMYFSGKPVSTLSNNDTWVSSNTWHMHMWGYVLAYDKAGEKKMYVFKNIDDKLHHSSPMAGQRVIDAGMMVVSEGKVAYIENKSGHYKPYMEQKLHTLGFLEYHGASLDDMFISNRKPNKPGQAQHDFLVQHLYSATTFNNYFTKAGQKRTSAGPRRLMATQHDSIDIVTARSWMQIGPNSPAKNMRTHGHELARQSRS